jgi:cytochrome c peroxidase
MAQIFHHSTNTFSRITIYGAVFFLAFLTWCFATLDRSGYETRQGEVREQAVPFSHVHHVADDGIDCRYCHTTVETSNTANIPPTRTSLVWTRVHDLPDYVYFNHSIHVNKGVGCETCHGRVDKMPLMYQQNSLQMEWCLDCHRNPERHVRPRSEVFTMGYEPKEDQEALGRRLVAEYKIQDARTLTSCNTCHR